MRLVGQMLSMGIAMLVLTLHIGASEVTKAVYPQFLKSQRTSFTIFALLCVVGVFASLARGKRAPIADRTEH